MKSLFDIKNKAVIITGGAGVLGSFIATEIARLGAKVCVVDYDAIRAHKVCEQIEAEGNFAIPVECDVLDKKKIKEAYICAVETMGKIDCLINAAGGNKKEATCIPPTTFFDLPQEVIEATIDLNLMGTILPTQVFGKYMAEHGEGVIINIASMCALRPLTNIAAYSAAKAAIANFTQWLSTYMATRHSPKIRVNAIAPGFFLTIQNRFLLMNDQSGDLTQRGKTIIEHTPMARFGQPADLIGTVVWLLSDASAFVSGIVVPIDGGFSAFSGV